MIKKIIILTILYFTPTIIIGQEISIGFHIGTNAFQKFSLTGTSYSPENSTYTYLPENSNTNLIIDKFKSFNNVTFGGNIRLSIKKFGLVLEPQLQYESSRFKFESSYETTRALNKKAFRMPVYGTYHLVKNINSVYLMAGVMISKEVYFDFQQPDIDFYNGMEDLYGNEINYGDDHFYKVFYNKPIRFDYLVGIGKKIKQVNLSIRYVNTLTPDEYMGEKWQFELNLAYYFISNKDLILKNYLYED